MTRREQFGLAVLCFTILLISLDQTVLNVALPTLIDDLHPSTSDLPWIADGYTLTNAVLLLFGGILGDRYGRRLMFLIGAVIFGAGSLLCALSTSTGEVIGTRAVMGVGAAALMPATLSIIAATFSGVQRAKAIGIWAGVSGIGTAAGPLIGGWLLQHFWWGSVFLINVPIAVIALVGGAVFIDESRVPQRPPLDLVGVVFSAAGLAAVTYGLIIAPDDGWSSPQVLVSLLAGLVLVGVFVIWERSQAEPLVDVELFRNRTFSSALGTVTAMFFALFAISYLLSQLIQFVQGADPLGVGLRFIPLALGTLISSNVSVRFATRIGLRFTMLIGMALVTGAFVVLAVIPANNGLVPICAAFSLLGLGLGLVVSPASNAIVGSLPPDKVGAGSGLRSMVQLLGGSFGVAILGGFATAAYHSHIHRALSTTLRSLPASVRPAVANQVGTAISAAHSLPPSLARATSKAASEGFLSGIHLVAVVGVTIVVLTMVVAALVIPDHIEHEESEIDIPIDVPA